MYIHLAYQRIKLGGKSVHIGKLNYTDWWQVVLVAHSLISNALIQENQDCQIKCNFRFKQRIENSEITENLWTLFFPSKKHAVWVYDFIKHMKKMF